MFAKEKVEEFANTLEGKELEIFMLSDQVGPGLPLWLPISFVAFAETPEVT